MKKLTVDFHAHILPKCDHGSDSLKTSLTQLTLAKNAGVDLICATSHFYPERDTVDTYLARRKKCFDLLSEQLNDSLPQVRLGAEVLICDRMDRMTGIEKLCLEGTDYLLLEMPFFDWSDDLVRTAERLSQLENISVVMAHADRYKPDDVEQMLEFGIPLQLNVDNLSKRFKNRNLLRWIDAGCVVAFGSDIHGTDIGYRYWSKSQRILGDRWTRVMEKASSMVSK